MVRVELSNEFGVLGFRVGLYNQIVEWHELELCDLHMSYILPALINPFPFPLLSLILPASTLL